MVPADLDDTVSFTSFNSLSASQTKPVMPRHSIRVSFYYQIDMRGWAVNSSVSMQSHVPSCIANVYRLLRRQGVPPHVSRHSPRIQLDLNDYDPASGIYELRYDVIPAESDEVPTERRTISSALKQFRLGSSIIEEGPELVAENNESTEIPQEHVLSDDDDDEEVHDMDNELSNEASRNGYVDVELDGERWGLGSDIVVHIFMNDIEDEEFVQEHVECLKYMGRNRYILRMKHTDIGSHQGAINVKLRIERIPQQNTVGNTKLLTRQQLVSQRQQEQEEQEQQQSDQNHLHISDLNDLIVSVNGHEKNILPFHRTTTQTSKRINMSLHEQLELSRQIVQEVDNSPAHWRPGSDGTDGLDGRATASPLLLMSSSMPTTMQSLNRSTQSILSNGTSTMTPGITNPSKVNTSYSYFNSLLQEPASSWKPISNQKGVQISKLEAQGHAPGIVKGEGVFENYSIWDIKAVLDCAAARKKWDKMLDESRMLQQATPSSTLCYLRFMVLWPSSPKDMAVLNTTFITKDAIHYFATSVDDTNLYPSIPPPQSQVVRSELVVSGWYLEAIKPQSVRIVYIAQATTTSWLVPGTSGALTEVPLAIAEVIKYLETYGSPPTLVSIRRGRATGVEYSHSKSSYRLEYVQDSNPIFSGHRPSYQQALDRQRRSNVDTTAGAGSTENLHLSSPKFGPTDKLLAEIRLDAVSWAKNGDCEITIDPPPSKVVCSCVPHDATGYRLRIEHSSGRAVPAGGKVLLMARKPEIAGCGLVVNGVPIKMPSMEHLETWTQHKAHSSEKDKALTLSVVDGALSANANQDDEDENDVASKTSQNDEATSLIEEVTASANGQNDDTENKRAPATLMAPMQYAQGSMDLLMKIRSDPEESWLVVSDTKGGLKVTKRFMPTEISDQVPLVRGEKVIEGFSMEEIATVVGTLGTRSKLDDLFESGEMMESFGAGCAIYHHVLKSYFPWPVPARDLYFITVTTSIEANTRCPQIVILSTSIPDEVIPTSSFNSIDTTSSSGASAPKPVQQRPRAHLHLSAWILEGIDPYSTSHPIPSTRVTYITALDLGGSVPQKISGLFQTTFPKAITQVESYLQLQSAPPIVRIPEQSVNEMILADTVSIDERSHEKTPALPSVWPWTKPASRILSREFNMKDSFCEIKLQFDQFRLHPSRLDFVIEKRNQKKLNRKSRGGEDTLIVDQDTQEENISTGAKIETNKNHTVLELIIDLKQYPLGYKVLTNIKVDPEFLLQQKQQRDLGLRHHLMSGSTSNLKLTSSASLATLSNPASNSSTKFIGGFDNSIPSSGSLNEINRRLSLDVTSTSEAASTGTGIAAVLGNPSNMPRSLQSSTSLIRILPPPVSVNVIDIPPAPSHSSSLSGVSKKQKHLIIITVPKPESSLSYVQAQQQAASKSSAPHAVSGSTAKPVVTTNPAAGTTSTMFTPDDRIDFKQTRQSPTSASSSQDLESEIDSKPPHHSGKQSLTPESASRPSTQYTPGALDLETRMFQFDVKIERLENKDLDQQDQKATDDSQNDVHSDREWSGKVIVDGLPVKIISGWSRQDLGCLDGVLEEELRIENHQRHRSKRRGKNSSSRKDIQSNGEISDQSIGNQVSEIGDDEHRRGDSNTGTDTRRKKYRRQHVTGLDENQVSPTRSHRDDLSSSPGIEKSSRIANDPTTDIRPTSSMYGLSSFLMNVGLLGTSNDTQKKSHRSAHAEDNQGNDVHRRHSIAKEDDNDDDDRTIRASKSGSRTRLSGILGINSSKNHKYSSHNDHDLDLESLHGSIVFKDDEDMDNYGSDRSRYSYVSNNHDENRARRHERRKTDRESLERSRRSGSLRRRKTSKDIIQSDEYDRRSSQDIVTENKHHRRGSRASVISQQQRSRSERVSTSRRVGSTNGADHPRFRGSKLYAYSFGNLIWTALACFLIGLILRIYVIGPSYSKTISSTSAPTYYYYYVAPKKTNKPMYATAESSTIRTDNGEEAAGSSVWPQGIQEVFAVRRILGWDYVLLAYPSQDDQQ
ncbi:hypothetical protein BGZ76_008179 [Entomortierella beljakovae]|nr:hypothetical protein BGZ76_008179 [Entomortierella beljakovae]